MFDALTDKLQGIFSGLRGRGKLTDADIDAAMRAIRLSLLEADVNLPVVKQLTEAHRRARQGRRGDGLAHAGPAGREDRAARSSRR